MAADPRLLLSAQPTDVGASFGNALLNVSRAQQIQQSRKQAELNEQTQPLRNRLLQAQTTTAEQGVQTPGDLGSARNIARLNSLAQFSQSALPRLASGDVEGTRALLTQRRQQLVSAAGQGQQVDTTETDEALALLDSNPELLAQRMQQSIDAAQQINQQGASAGQREFAALTSIVEADPDLQTQEGQAAAVKLGIEPRAGISASERIVQDPELTKLIADFEAKKAGSVEGAKLGQQLKFKPKIQALVKLAEADASARGETLTTLKRAQAALPGLTEVVDTLKQLAPIATSTIGGKVFNSVVKELGFGATKGSTARAKFIAIVSNQVLPLLRETFGAAFTAKEGDELKATMGDPDSSPDEKIAQLNAFIEQKIRSIETSEREVAEPAATVQVAPTVLQFDAQGNLVQ